MDIDSYIDRVVAPAEDPNRVGACAIIADLGPILEEERDGPYYSAVVEMEFDDDVRQVGCIVQDRAVQNGAWMPEHHLAAARHRIVTRNRIPFPICNARGKRSSSRRFS